jgi:hypothetical protein
MKNLKSLLSGLLVSGALFAVGCNVLNTRDDENVRGRGAQAFDPYEGSRSGAIRLSLSWFNGCAILPNGRLLQKGTAKIPYPETCADPHSPTLAPRAPDQTLELVAETTYFLDRFSLMDSVLNQHKDPKNAGAALDWMRRDSRFKGLNWMGAGVTLDEYRPLSGGTGENVNWYREVIFGNAAWMRDREDSFLLEVLDKSGEVLNSIVYKRSAFLAENPTSGHTQVSWRSENILPPTSPGDTGNHGTATFRTTVRVDLATSTDPFHNFTLGPYVGDGAVRLTWSQIPNEPFYFPVKFLSPLDVPSTCFDGETGTQRVVCDFGLNPELKLGEPENGKFFKPGETVSLYMRIRDGSGNLLHPLDSLPSYSDYMNQKSNGIQYANSPHFITLLERDSTSSLKVAGPIHMLKTQTDVSVPPQYFVYPRQYGGSVSVQPIVPGLAARELVPGLTEMRWPTRHPVLLPQDAEPGTYLATMVVHRYERGERVSRTATAQFQVGHESVGEYPGQVGNCQICHRGVLSLENVRHGMAVDHVEGCKSCHQNTGTNWARNVHRLHAFSEKFPLKRNDCRTCHLTRDSAINPSVELCSGCHLTMHGDKFFAIEYSTSGAATRYGNCAQACHVNQLPTSHILPDN